MMSGIRSRNTRPELLIRHALHRQGYRFRLHDRTLKGTPDIVLPKYRAVIFVHGCFWHGHDCSFFRMPATRTAFWKQKFERNMANDELAVNVLRKQGWRILTVWECALRGRPEAEHDRLISRIDSWLKSGRRHLELRERRAKQGRKA
jgi:DNA mismatch endonuclease (patch repair protein)